MATRWNDVGMLSDIEVTAFNQLMRKYALHADTKFSFFSDVIYDAALIANRFAELGPEESEQCYWYVRAMGTYMRCNTQKTDYTVPCHAVYLLDLERLPYGSPVIKMTEVYGPFNMLPPNRGEV